MEMTETRNDDEGKKDFLFVNSVGKAVQVLESFRDDGESASLTEIANKTGLSLSAAQRFTHTWESLGYLQKDPQSKRFRLTVATLELGYLFLRGNPLVARATPHMMMSHAEHGLPINLSVLSGSDVIYVVRLPHRRLKFVETLPDGASPPSATAPDGRCCPTCRTTNWMRSSPNRRSPSPSAPSPTPSPCATRSKPCGGRGMPSPRTRSCWARSASGGWSATPSAARSPRSTSS
jgi:hypothetical protein